jgi:hypothetical protein
MINRVLFHVDFGCLEKAVEKIREIFSQNDIVGDDAKTSRTFRAS